MGLSGIEIIRIIRIIRIICAALAVSVPATAFTADANAVVVWPHGEGALNGPQKRAVRQLRRAVDRTPNWASASPRGGTRRALARIGRRCRPIASDACATEAAAAVDTPYLLSVAFSSESVALVLVEGDTVRGRDERSATARTVRKTLLDAWDALNTKLESPSDSPLATDESESEDLELALTPPPPPPPNPPPPPPTTTPEAAPEAPEPAPQPKADTPAPSPPPQSAAAGPTDPKPTEPATPAPATNPPQPPTDDVPTPGVWTSTDPDILHAEALLAETDGDATRALTMLREAASLAPAHPAVAYDRARLAYELDSPTLAEDGAALLAADTDALDRDARLMRGYLLIRQGNRRQAAREIAASAPNEVRAETADAETTEDDPWFGLRVRLGTTVDSNVTVLPELAPSQILGVRALLDTTVRVSPLRGDLRFDIEARGTYGPHVNDRDATEAYDVATAWLTGRLSYRGKGWGMRVEAAGQEVAVAGFRAHFMQQGVLAADVYGLAGPFRLGGYARAAYRDFVFGNPEVGVDPNGPLSDRDGTRITAGFRGALGAGPVRASLQLGGLAELVEGRRQRVRGGEGLATIGWQIAEPVSLTVGVAYELRHFPRAKDAARDLPSKRWDHRVTPLTSLRWQATDSIAVFGSYAYVNNTSTHGYGYQRHLGTVGLESAW